MSVSIQAAAAPATRSGEVMLVAFLGTATMLFAGFTAAYLIRRAGSDWRPIELPSLVWGSTTVLALASAAVELAARGASLRSSRRWAVLTLALGLVFLLVQIAAWNELRASGIALGTTPQASFFYVLACVHAVHVLGGIGVLVWVLARASAFRLCATYWHFLALVWLYVLGLLRIG